MADSLIGDQIAVNGHARMSPCSGSWPRWLPLQRRDLADGFHLRWDRYFVMLEQTEEGDRDGRVSGWPL